MAKHNISDLYKSPQPSKKFLSGLVGDYSRHTIFGEDREIGLEFEFEGRGANAMQSFAAPPEGKSPIHWVFHMDNSLRGDTGEMVLKRPLNRRQLPEAFEQLDDIKKKASYVPELSHRCSVHVHLNVNYMTNYELVKYITIYSIYELYFFDVHGAQRKGNPFCLRLSDSASFARTFVDCLIAENYRTIGNENYRYMALNLAALLKYGSLEFRSHEGSATNEPVVKWVDCLLEILDWVRENYKASPPDILYELSNMGLEDFTKTNFPKIWEYIEPVFKLIPYRIPVNIAQDIAFGADWVNAPEEKIIQKKTKRKSVPNEDPFERPAIDPSNLEQQLHVLRLRESELLSRRARTPGGRLRDQIAEEIRQVRTQTQVITAQLERTQRRVESEPYVGVRFNIPHAGANTEELLGSTYQTLTQSGIIPTGTRIEGNTISVGTASDQNSTDTLQAGVFRRTRTRSNAWGEETNSWHDEDEL